MTNLMGGSRLGHYELVEVLGQGGMATVYRARQLDLKREVALKVIKPGEAGTEEFLKRFKREIETISSLNHRHIVPVFDHGQYEGVVYLVMKLLVGGSLCNLIQQGPLNPQEVERILSQVASALDYTHQKGIIHRDLKPQNIMFNAEGDTVLTDFGVAKVLYETTLTQRGTMIGTPAYMPPEQWRGETIDARADVYALGIILFEMLAGTLPFQGASPAHWIHLHTYENPPAITTLQPGIPSDVAWIINKALAKHRDGRFSTAVEMARTFRAVLKEHPSWATPPGPHQTNPSDEHTWTLPNQPSFETDMATRTMDAKDDAGNRDATISPAQAADQERRALAMLQAEMQRRASRPHSQFINPLPLEIRDRYKGRMREQTNLASLLVAGTRLIGIYGRGGVGKTALACKVLADLREAQDGSRPDGMVFLSAITTGIDLNRLFSDLGKLLKDETRHAFEEVARNPKTPTVQKISTLLNALKTGRHILLLDNLETLQHPETGELTDSELQAFFEVALNHEGSLTILVTSREPLSLPGEFKDHEQRISLEEGLQIEDAVELLQASDAEGTVGLRDAPIEKLAAIAQKMRGFPRALEAVVGLLLEDRTLTLDTLLQEKGDSAILDTDVTPHIVQQALDRLRPDAFRVMEGLAIFEIPVTQAALEFLLAPYLDTEHLDTILNRLTRSYFVAYNKVVQTFALHPIDRHYCYRRIPDGTADDKPIVGVVPIYTGHALHYRAAEFYRHQREPEDTWKSIEDLAPQLAEFEHLVSADDYNAAAELLRQFDANYLIKWGNYASVIDLHERIRGKITDNALVPTSLVALGRGYHLSGHISQAITCYEQGLCSAQQSGDNSAEASALNNLGTINRIQGNEEQATQYYQQALTLAQKLHDKRGQAVAFGNLGTLYGLGRQFDQAAEYFRQALELYRAVQDKSGENVTLRNLGLVHKNLQQIRQALPYYEQALALAQEIGERSNEGLALNNLGSAYLELGQYERAIEYYQQSLIVCRQINHRETELQALGNLGLLYRRLGRVDQSLLHYAQTLAISRDIGYKYFEANAMAELGMGYLANKDHTQAIEHLQRAISIADEINNNDIKDHCLGYIVLAHLASGDLAMARETLMAMQAFSKNEYEAKIMYGLTLVGLDDPETARTVFENAIPDADAALATTPDLFDTFYIRGVAKAGLALVTQGDLQPSMDDYQSGRAICAAQGVVAEHLLCLDALIACPGGERLHPIRSVLIGER